MIKCPISGKVCLKFKAFHVTDIVDQKANVINICEDCLSQVDEKKILSTEIPEKEGAPVQEEKPIDKKPEDKIICEFCKLSLEELINKSRLGCENCYYIFEKPLVVALERIQRTPDIKQKELKHVGRVPTQWKKRQAEKTDPKKFLLELKQKLAMCVREENYKLASELKNIIKGFEALCKKIDEFKEDSEQWHLIRTQISEFIYLFREKELEK